MSFEYEDMDRVEKRGYSLGFTAAYSLFNEAVTYFLGLFEKDEPMVHGKLMESRAFKEFQARWFALFYTGCDLVEETSRQDIVDNYRSHEELELKEVHEKLNVELSPDAREKLEALAKEKGQTVSEFVSEIVLENTKQD